MSDTAVVESGTRLQNFLDRAGLRGFPWKTATILYTISWGWLFIVHDSYWSDDWQMFTEYANIDLGRQGFAPWYEALVDSSKIVGPTVLRLIIFISYFTVGLLLKGILEKFEYLNDKQRQFTVLAFLLLPFNSVRVSLMVLLYTLSYFVFFLAWYLLVHFKSQKIYISSLLVFFFSFLMHSLLLFYFLPMFHIFYLSESKNLRDIVSFARANYRMLFLPIIYWTMRKTFWPEEISYHDVSLARLAGTAPFVVFSGILLFLAFVFQRKTLVIRQSLQIIFVGILSLFLGVFAYVVLGFFTADMSFFSNYIVTFLGRSDWYSRHQTLQPLGAALLIVGVIGLLPKFFRGFTKQIQVFILTVCVVLNIGFGFEYVVDHSKQREVINQLKDEGEGKSGSNYQFVDQTILLNARGRSYRERDWDGLIWLAYGVESMQSSRVATTCDPSGDARLVLIQGPETHWDALKNWVSDGDMGFEVMVDDTPGACKPEMVRSEKVSGVIPILFYFTGAKG